MRNFLIGFVFGIGMMGSYAYAQRVAVGDCDGISGGMTCDILADAVESSTAALEKAQTTIKRVASNANHYKEQWQACESRPRN